MESFYKDPEKDLNDPEVCLPCDCNLDGTIPFGDTGDTSCVSIPEEGEIPGQCNCKTHVAGRQCDHCAPGWLSVCQRLKLRRTNSAQVIGTSQRRTRTDANSARATSTVRSSLQTEAATRTLEPAPARGTSLRLETVTSANINTMASQSLIRLVARRVTVILEVPTTTTVTSKRANVSADPISR